MYINATIADQPTLDHTEVAAIVTRLNNLSEGDLKDLAIDLASTLANQLTSDAIDEIQFGSTAMRVLNLAITDLLRNKDITRLN